MASEPTSPRTMYAVALLKIGESNHAIGEFLGVPTTTVASWASRYGLQRCAPRITCDTAGYPKLDVRFAEFSSTVRNALRQGGLLTHGVLVAAAETGVIHEPTQDDTGLKGLGKVGWQEIAAYLDRHGVKLPPPPLPDERVLFAEGEGARCLLHTRTTLHRAGFFRVHDLRQAIESGEVTPYAPYGAGGIYGMGKSRWDDAHEMVGLHPDYVPTKPPVTVKALLGRGALRVRTANALRAAGIDTLADLACAVESGRLHANRIPHGTGVMGLGARGWEEVQKVLFPEGEGDA